MKTTRTPAAPHVIQPTAVYTTDQLREALRLKAETLRREVRLGRIRVSRRAGRYYFLGEWVLAWIASGAVDSSTRPNGMEAT